MTIRRLLAVAMLAGALAPVTGNAAAPATRNIEVRTAAYVAYNVAANAGDIITWRDTGGQHEIQSYGGATTWNSSDPNNAQPDGNGVCPSYPCGGQPGGMTPYQTYSVNFTGGTIKYRCTLTHVVQDSNGQPKTVSYSTLDANGNCTGMCGSVTSAPPADLPGVPAITAPAASSLLTATNVPFSGTAPNASTVLLRQRLTGNAIKELGTAAVNAGSWTMNYDFGSNGTYTVDAIGIHADGFRSDPSSTLTFSISAGDKIAPTVRLDKPLKGVLSPTVDSIQTGRLDVDGRAFDDVAIQNVEVTVHPLDALNLTGAPDVHPNVVFTAGVPETTFHADLTPGTGWYVVTVVATDTSTKKSAVQSRQVIVVF